MKSKKIIKKFIFTLAFGFLYISPTPAVEPPAGIVGKNEWLFYRYELSDSSHSAQTQKSLELIKDFQKVLTASGIRLVVAMVPIKMRIYSEYLPDEVKMNDFLTGNYARMLEFFRANGVLAVDLNTALLTDVNRSSDSPLFFRLDSHWTPSGAMAAAKAIKAGIDADADSKKIVDALPVVSYSIKIANRKRASRGRDLVDALPANSPAFALEYVTQVNVTRVQPSNSDLLGNQAPPDIALLGSSYSRDWTGFPEALRFVLERDVASVAFGADQGSWVGMESYLRDDAFQTKRPKLLIWEMPERDMKAPPDYKYRDARYVMDNADWLRRVATLIQSAAKRHP